MANRKSIINTKRVRFANAFGMIPLSRRKPITKADIALNDNAKAEVRFMIERLTLEKRPILILNLCLLSMLHQPLTFTDITIQ